MIGIVTKVNMSSMTVEVQPAVMGKHVAPDGTLSHVLMPVIPDVPIVFPSGGGYVLTFPIAVGDECDLHSHSRSFDNWFESGGTGMPAHARMHDVSDVTAHFGPKSKPNVISNISSTSVQLRSNDGTVIIDINQRAGTITLTVPISITLNAPGGVVLNSPEGLVVTGPVTATVYHTS
jgi:hypothetical protein